MLNFTKKSETIIESVVTKEVEGAAIWMVSWNSFYGEYSDTPHLVGVKRVAKAFLSHENAKTFAESLVEASKLLQSDRLVWDIKITKQE